MGDGNRPISSLPWTAGLFRAYAITLKSGAALRRFIAIFLILSASAFAGSAESLATDAPAKHVLAFSGLDVASYGGIYGYAGGQLAPYAGGLDNSGLRFWLLGDVGQYKYPGISQNIRDNFAGGDALIGYGLERDNLSANLYVGLNYQDHRLSTPDPENSVQGSRAGFKVRADVWDNPTPNTLLYGEGSYSTAFETYYASAKAGYSLLGASQDPNARQLFFGPQVTILGDEQTREWRVGGHLTSANWGIMDFVVSAGYLHNSDNGAGAYGLVELSTSF